MTDQQTDLDPAISSGYEVLSVLRDETDALDMVLLRCRSTMLLASAGEVGHLDRASADLDAATETLDLVSRRRSELVESAIGVWGGAIGGADDLIDAAPAEFRDAIRSHIEIQRNMLEEAREAVEVASVLSSRSLDVLSRRREHLETSPRPVVYGSPNQVPPTTIAEHV
jgi:hypothetical protein